jgi:O-glycosyl hydrolase
MQFSNKILMLLLCLFACQGKGALEPITPTPNPSTPTTAKTVTISVDTMTQFQTIEGFGGFGAQKVWWAGPPFFNDDFINLLINDLGVTILRDDIPANFEIENDNDDPYQIDWSKFNTSINTPDADSHLGIHFSYLKAMHKAGLKHLIASIWSPPVWMKHNNHPGNGTRDKTDAPPYNLNPDENTNQLKVENYEEFAEYCLAYIQLLKKETGIDLYAISLQNEPRFSQFYASSVHSPESLRDLIKVVGNRFDAEGVQTKIFAPEDVQSIWHINQYLDAILADPKAIQHVDIFAIHNYQNDGVHPSDEGPKNWQETAQKAQAADKVVWMSETSGFDPNRFEGGLDLAKSMYNALHFGHATAWVYWQMSESYDKGFLTNGQPTWLYYISKHFYRSIRPSAISVQITESEADLLSLAFFHPETGDKTIVLINIGENEFNISLDADFATASFNGFLSDDNNQYKNIETVNNQKINIKGKSILTLTHK